MSILSWFTRKAKPVLITVPRCPSTIIFCGCRVVCSQYQEFYTDEQLALRGMKRRPYG